MSKGGLIALADPCSPPDNRSPAIPRPYQRERLDGDAETPTDTGAAADERIPPAPRKAVGRKGFDPKMRDALVDAACAILSETGVEGVKARAIAKRAGIAVGSVYNLFTDLDDVLRAANARTYDDLYAAEMTALDQAGKDGAAPPAQMLALALAYLDFVKNNQRRWQGVLAFNRRQTEPPPRWYLEKELGLFQIIERVIAPLPGAADPVRRRITAHALWASIHGVVTLSIANGHFMQPAEDVWEQIKVVVNAVAADLQTPAGQGPTA